MAEKGIWLPLWQIHYGRTSSGDGGETSAQYNMRGRLHKIKNKETMMKKRKKKKKKRSCGVYMWRFVQETHCVLVGAMRNSVQCCEWAGRYFMNGGGSCDRSTSRSRYFSLTVNKRTQGIGPLKQHTHTHTLTHTHTQNTRLEMGATCTNTTS